MKENKRLKILLIILAILIVIAILVNTLIPKVEFMYNFLKGTEWTLEKDDINESIYLYENGDFSYINNKTGENVKEYDSCTKYELIKEYIKLDCDKEIKIITSSDEKLYLKLDGKVKIFTKIEDKNYKLFQVGYIESTNNKAILTNYEDFNNYLNTNSSKFYDGEGNVVSTSTDAIKNLYSSDYFNDKNLAIFYVKTNSGSIKLSNIKSLIDNNTIAIKYDLIIPEIGTMDMNGYMIVVEIDKSITNIK